MLFFRYFPQALHVKFSFIVVYSRQTRSKVVMMAALQTLLLLNCSRQDYGGFKGTYMYFSFFFSLLATCELQVATRELLLITCDLLPASSDMLLATIASCHLLFRLANYYLRVATHGFFFWGACKPTFHTFYTSHLRRNSNMRRCFYHTNLRQNAVSHNFSRQIEPIQYSEPYEARVGF